MPAYTQQRAWRQRKDCIGKKQGYESELLMESDVSLEVAKVVDPSSPISIASTFDLQDGLMQPIMLPDTWIVVGKGGRPLKNAPADKLYDEPAQKKKKHKKKKARARRVGRDESDERPDESDALDERPSTSRCVEMVERAAARREKALADGREAKLWRKYRRNKEASRFARDMLRLSLAEDGGALSDDDADSAERPAPPKSLTKHSCKANGHGEKARRTARRASAAARCCVPETEDTTLADGGLDASAGPPARRGAAKAKAGGMSVPAVESAWFSSRSGWHRVGSKDLAPDTESKGAAAMAKSSGESLNNKRKESLPAEAEPPKVSKSDEKSFFFFKKGGSSTSKKAKAKGGSKECSVM